VLRRRSSRNFTNSDISRDEMAALVEALCSEPEGHTRAGGQARGSISAGFLAERVDTLAKGFYLLNREDMTISQCSSGKMVESMTSVCLGQGWLSRSAVHFVFLANLAVLDERYGPRGYRYAMLSAGRLGQRLYVAATALGLGCCGIGAFFDDEAARLLGLPSATRMLYLVAVGPLKKRSLG
jgi:SagB-type dehydrogenase family enzyme